MRVPDLKKMIYPDAAVRTCINCKKEMQSMGRGHRRCARCKLNENRLGNFALMKPVSFDDFDDFVAERRREAKWKNGE